MKHKTSRWELILMVGFMVILVVGLWGTSGSGLRFGSQVLAAGVPQVTTAGGNERGTIVSPGTGTGKVMPAALSGSGAAGQVTFWTGTESLSGDNDLYWDNSNKRLGIGTASPLRKLHYYGDAALFQRSVDAAGFIIQRTDTNRWVFGASEASALGQGFSIYTYPVGAGSATPRLFIDLSGNVGIGTTSPTYKLHVDGGSGNAIRGNSGSALGVHGVSQSSNGVQGDNSGTGNQGYLGGISYGARGSHFSGNYGYLGSSNYGVFGGSSGSAVGVQGQNGGNYGFLGGSSYGVLGASSGTSVYGAHSGGNYGYLADSNYGAFGLHSSSGNYGYLGNAAYGAYGSDSSGNFGALGDSVNAFGVYGQSSSTNYGYLGGATRGALGSHSGGNYGYLGDVSYGVYGVNTAGNFGYLGSSTEGVYGKETTTGNYGYLGSSTYGVYGQEAATGNKGYLGDANYGVRGDGTTGVYGKYISANNYGYLGDVNYGVYGSNASNTFGFLAAGLVGAEGQHPSGNYGDLGTPTEGVHGQNGLAPFCVGKLGTVTDGVYGQAPPGGALAGPWAGNFNGDVQITGGLLIVAGPVVKPGGAFRIDHPLDPEHKYLQHSFVESPDMMNVYNGNIVLDENGEAVVELPAYFEALNRDFRYQLTCIGGYAPVYIAEKVKDNSFKIAGGTAGMEVSWQVTGIRHDDYADANRIQVEVDKPGN